MMGGFGGHGWGMGWWWIIGLIIVVAIVWSLVKLMNKNTSSTQSPEKSALDILKERYAREFPGMTGAGNESPLKIINLDE